MTAPYPTRYLIDGDERVYLACRTTTTEQQRTLLLLVEDTDEQHPLDTVAIHLDDPRLRVAPSPAREPGKHQNGERRSPA